MKVKAMGLSSSLFAGISGLQRHQQRLDVIGNNLANVNTYGFKSQRVLFQDLLYQTISPDSAPNARTGGTNPSQVGFGVDLGVIDTNFNQGSFEVTGIETDLAIDGNGFFVLRDGSSSYFTRDGAFTLNTERKLVAPSSGMHVQGWNQTRDNTGQSTVNTGGALEDVVIPVGDNRIAKATSEVIMNGNLNGAGAVSTSGTILNSQRLFSSSTGDVEITSGEYDLKNVYIKDPAGGVDNVRLFNGTGSDGGDSFVLTSGDQITVQLTKGGRALEAIFTYGNGDTINNTTGNNGPDGLPDANLEAYDGTTLNDFLRWFDVAFGLTAAENEGATNTSNAAHGFDGDNPNDLVDMGKNGANPFTDETDGSGFNLIISQRGAEGLSGNTTITPNKPQVAIQNSTRTFNLVAGSNGDVNVGNSYVDIDGDGAFNPDKDITLTGVRSYVVTGNSTVSQGGAPFGSTTSDLVLKAFDISGKSSSDMYVDTGSNGVYDKGVDPIIKGAFSTDVFGATTTTDSGTPGVVSTLDNRMTVTYAATGLNISKGLMVTGTTAVTDANNNAGLNYDATGGNSGAITVTLVDPGADNTGTSVSVSGSTVTVTLERSGGALVATQQDVVDAINSNLNASQLVYATTTSAATTAAAGTDTFQATLYTVESVVESSGSTVVTFDKTFNASDLPGGMVAASATGTGANANLTMTAKVPGTAGNSIQVVLDQTAANSTLGVSVSGTTITVTLAADGTNTVTSTLAQIAAAINGHSAASALVTASVTVDGTAANADETITLGTTGTAVTGANASTLTYRGAALVQAGYSATSSSAMGDTLISDVSSPLATQHPTTGNWVGQSIYNTAIDNEKGVAGSEFIKGSSTYRIDLAPARAHIQAAQTITAGTTTTLTVDQINNATFTSASTLSALGLQTGMTVIGATSGNLYTIDSLVQNGTTVDITFDKAITDANDFSANSNIILGGFVYSDVDNDSTLNQKLYRVNDNGGTLYIDLDHNGQKDNGDLDITTTDLATEEDNASVFVDPNTGNVYRKVPLNFDSTNRYVYLDPTNSGTYSEPRFNLINGGGSTASTVKWIVDEDNDGKVDSNEQTVVSTGLGAVSSGTVSSIASDTATMKAPTGSVINQLSSTSGSVQIRGNIGSVNELSNISFISGSDNTERNIFQNSALTNGTEHASSLEKSADGESVSQNIVVFDSLGTAHDVNLTFVLEEKDNDKATWRWYAETGDASQKNGNFPASDPRGNKPGINVGSGKIIFDNFGRFLRNEPQVPLISIPLEGLNTDSALQINPDFSILTSFANSGGSEVDLREQDGFAQGVMDRFTIGADGTVTGIYTNGLRETVAQIATAAFANPDGLNRAGSNLFTVGSNSGNAMIGAALTGERGSIRSQTLEQSNVDITTSFTNLISTQRGYQANSRVITKSDELLQELIQIVR